MVLHSGRLRGPWPYTCTAPWRRPSSSYWIRSTIQPSTVCGTTNRVLFTYFNGGFSRCFRALATRGFCSEFNYGYIQTFWRAWEKHLWLSVTLDLTEVCRLSALGLKRLHRRMYGEVTYFAPEGCKSHQYTWSRYCDYEYITAWRTLRLRCL